MRKLWQEQKQIAWDDPIPTEHKIKWTEFFEEMFQMQEVPFQRCLKPNSVIGNPSLIIFRDGSDEAFGSCAYIRWELQIRYFCSRLIMSKNRVTPLRKMTPVRSELCGAVLSAKIWKFIIKKGRFSFQRECC